MRVLLAGFLVVPCVLYLTGRAAGMSDPDAYYSDHSWEDMYGSSGDDGDYFSEEYEDMTEDTTEEGKGSWSNSHEEEWSGSREASNSRSNDRKWSPGTEEYNSRSQEHGKNSQKGWWSRFSGKVKDIVDRCQKSPCINNGTCQSWGLLLCDCPSDWEGRHCELPRNLSGCNDMAVFTCIKHCPFGMVKNDTTGCVECDCNPDPCLTHSCNSTHHCKLEKQFCHPDWLTNSNNSHTESSDKDDLGPPGRGWHAGGKGQGWRRGRGQGRGPGGWWRDGHDKMKQGFFAMLSCKPIPKCVPIPKPEECPDLRNCAADCKYGLKINIHGCKMCRCKSPCEGVEVPLGYECRVEKTKCYSKQQCRDHPPDYFPELRKTQKSGKCPAGDGGGLYIWDKSNLNQSIALTSSGDVWGNHLASANGCEVTCSDDADCSGLSKCCHNGCGTQCLWPDFSGESQCRVHLEVAKSMGEVWYEPQCTEDGLYERVQCRQDLSGAANNDTICYCVHQYTGEALRGTMGLDGETNCTVSEHACPKLRCHGIKKCPFGFEPARDGCKTCHCQASPCQEHRCMDGQVCELLTFQCKRTPCKPQPVCLDADWDVKSCPWGEALKVGMPPTPELCEQASSNASCPSTHFCLEDHGLSNMTRGICCPKHQSLEREGICPPGPKWCGQHSTNKCEVDSQCLGNYKCCKTVDYLHYMPFRYHKEKDACHNTCVPPRPNFEHSCTRRLQDAYIEIRANHHSAVFVPRCQLNGTWQSIQCHDVLGMCWCVDEFGSKKLGTTVRGSPHCHKEPASSTDPPVCPRGVPVKRCDVTMCFRRQCAADPAAVCRINPCGTCRVEFYNSHNSKVDCTAGVSPCKRRQQQAYDVEARLRPSAPLRQKFLRAMWEDFADTSGGYVAHSGSEAEDLLKWEKRFFHRRRGPSPAPAQELRCPSAGSLGLRDCHHLDTCAEDADCGLGLICCPLCGHRCVPTHNAETTRPRCRRRPQDCMDFLLFLDEDVDSEDPYYYDEENDRCEAYKCPSMHFMISARSNVFMTKADCERNCQAVPSLSGLYIPQCEGALFSPLQCVGVMCWCVHPQTGSPTNASLTKNLLECDGQGKPLLSSNPPAVCPDGSQPAFCHDACLHRTCEDSRFQCMADPCNNCAVTLLMEGPQKDLTCEGTGPDICGLSPDPGPCLAQTEMWHYNSSSKSCQAFIYGGCKGNANRFTSQEACESRCHGELCPGHLEMRVCDDPCRSATCPRFPEAECRVDLCTCGFTFHNPDGGEHVICTEPRTLCERSRAAALRSSQLAGDGEAAAERGQAVPVPQCREDGSFWPMQCTQQGRVCWCVDDAGQERNATRVDLLITKMEPFCAESAMLAVKLSFRILQDFSLVQNQLDNFLKLWRAALSDVLGVKQDHIVDLKAQAGSIIVSFTVLHAEGADLASELAYLQDMIYSGQLVIDFLGRHFAAAPLNVTLEPVRDVLEAERLQPAATPAPALPANQVQVGAAAPPSEQQEENTVHIVGGVLGTVAAIVVLAVAVSITLMFLRQRRGRPGWGFSSMGFDNPVAEGATSISEGATSISIHNNGSVSTA